MASALCVQTKGLGVLLCSRMKRAMASFSSVVDAKLPRLRRLRVRMEKKPSTALSQEADVGVKWNTQRGCLASQATTFGCLWVA